MNLISILFVADCYQKLYKKMDLNTLIVFGELYYIFLVNKSLYKG